MSRHPVNPRHRRRPVRRPARQPLRRPANPIGNPTGDERFGAGVCRVGELLVPALGAHRVAVIAAAGGLLPYLARHRWLRGLAYQFAQALPLSLIAAGLLLLNAAAPY